ncbi:MAG TPA: hypothetical protein VM285_14285 [Polyangia bacterium]|nr:hypothetical protein [Polyangia bacterium]
MRHRGFRLLALPLATALLVFTVAMAISAGVEDTFAGKVLVLTKRPPGYFKTQGAFVQWLRSHSTGKVFQNEAKEWEFETMAFFKRPLGDYECEVAFYDVTDGKSSRRFVDGYAQQTMDRNTRILAHKARLTRPQFDANRSYIVVVQHRGKELAKGSFSTQGTTQASIDQQQHLEHEMKKMEASLKEMERKAKEQEEQAKKEGEKDKSASEDLF